MSNIKSPEEYYDGKLSKYNLLNKVDPMTAKQVMKIMQAYHEYASELEREQKIEELDSIAKVNEQIISSTQQYSQGIRKAIEILKK